MKSLVIITCLLFVASSMAFAVNIPTVPVGNAGNAPDSTGYGAVSYEYRIGTTEVTNAQYVEFLNAKAASDPLGLYSTSMESDPIGGIIRSGADGNYVYASKPNMGNKPVNYVSGYDAFRFANWLHNGQGTGDTETGAYTLTGDATTNNGISIARNPGATWFVPSSDEWYKAAYHQPAVQGGDADDYWLFPTASNSEPIGALANSVGNISNPGANVANYLAGAGWNGESINLTTVGSAGPLSNSFYGTADQGGNVFELTETPVVEYFRDIRGGGAWNSNSNYLSAHRTNYLAGRLTSESVSIGFRLASIPEPSTYILAAIGVLGLQTFRRRKSAT